jgi:hypothetical protein
MSSVGRSRGGRCNLAGETVRTRMTDAALLVASIDTVVTITVLL